MDENMALMEFSGLVTQLAGGSEVIIIGIKITAPIGSYIEIEDFVFEVDNITAGKNAYIYTENTIAEYLTKLNASLDAQYLKIHQSVIADATVGVVNQEGFKLPIILGGAMKMYAVINDTLDATKKCYMRCLYRTLNGVVPTFTAVGAGITLTTSSHKQI